MDLGFGERSGERSDGELTMMAVELVWYTVGREHPCISHGQKSDLGLKFKIKVPLSPGFYPLVHDRQCCWIRRQLRNSTECTDARARPPTGNVTAAM